MRQHSVFVLQRFVNFYINSSLIPRAEQWQRGLKQKSLTLSVRLLKLTYIVKLNQLYVHSVQSFFTFFQVVSYFVVFSDFIYQTRYVYKILLTCAFVLNESKTFFFIKEFYFSFVHDDDD